MRSLERVTRGHPPDAAIAGHFGLGRLALHAGACVSVARALCGGRTMHGPEPHAARRHALTCVQPQFSYAQPRASDAWAPTGCRLRRPLWARSARTTRGRLRMRCSHAVWRAHDARARALCRSQARARSCSAAISTRSLEQVGLFGLTCEVNCILTPAHAHLHKSAHGFGYM